MELATNIIKESMDFLRYIYSADRIDQVSALTKNVDVWLPRQHIVERVLPELAVTTTGIFALFAVFLWVFRGMTDRPQRYTMAYRCTNILVTTALGALGAYGEFYVLPHLPTDEVTTYVRGLQDHITVVNLMFGFQLWAIVVGTLLVRENFLMMWHHVAVFLVCIMYSSFTNGFRYHMYYFGGVWEISSIPFAVMNILREHGTLKDKYPGLYFAVKATFAASFLILRIWIGTRRAIRYVTDLFVVFYSTTKLENGSVLYSAFMFLMWFMSFYLGILQFYWAYKIAIMVGRNAQEFISKQRKKLKVT